MKRRILVIVVMVGVLAVVLMSRTLPAMAQTPTPTGMWVGDVTPATVLNTANTPLTISGGNFTPQVRVAIIGSGYTYNATIDTSNPAAPFITFTLPAGFPVGTYALQVINGDAALALTTNDLTVNAPVPTVAGPTNTPAPTNFVRPMVMVFSYGASSVKLVPGQDFEIEITLQNTGRITASNIVTTFVAGDFVPRATGGVRSVEDLGPGQASKFYQYFTATTELAGKKIGIMEVKVSYTDAYGAAYTETFTLTYPMTGGGGGGGGPTVTPTISPRPQLIISGYDASEDMLQPGTEFTLELETRNVGSGTAKAVSAIVGGGSSSGSGGTPGPGGVSGGSGEFTNFAPVGSSNIQVLGDMESGASKKASQKLIVNVSTNPGAYPLKVSFIYADERNTSYTDEQVITLLVYRLPSVDVTFYRPIEPLFVGQMGALPLQVANMGRSSAVLGNMTVTAGDAQMENNTLIVGNVDPGFPVTLDAMVMPTSPGPLEVEVTIEYTDDFNKPRTITKMLEVEVMEGPELGPEGMMEGEEGMPTLEEPETLIQSIWRFIRGLIGLDSARSDTGGSSIEGMPIEEMPSEGMPSEGRPTEPPIKAVPVEGKGG